MKRYLCARLALALLCGMALAETETPEAEASPVEGIIEAVEVIEQSIEEPEDLPAEEPKAESPSTVRMGFEDGFALELPEGWLYHLVTEEMAEQGVVYCLSNAEGTGWLYVQNWFTDCATLDELKELIDRTTRLQTSGVYTFNGTDFVVYDLMEGDVSCCAALVDGRALNLVFTPQSDADFMAVAAQILNTFEIL